MKAPSSYKPVEAALKVLKIIPVLAGHEFTGKLPGEIATAIGVSAASVGHYLKTLEEIGYAEQIPETGRWRLGPKIVQISIAFMRHMDDQERKTSEVKNRFTREP